MEFDLDKGFRIAEWEVRPRQSAISRDGETSRMEPKVMAVLVCMAHHAGEVVTRDEFAEEVWRGRIVSDEVLSRDISLLRSQLGDDAKDPKFVQTVPRVGYRLIVQPEPLERPAAERQPRRTNWFAIGVATGALVLVAAWVTLRGPEFDLQAGPPATTIAVLPFDDQSDGDNEYFSDGLTDEILETLSKVEGLKVVARTSSFSFRDGVGAPRDIRAIGDALGAGSLIEGSVRRDRDRLRITARLVNANDGLQVWSQSYDRRLAAIFDVQTEISRAIVEKLVGTLAPDVAVVMPPTEDMEAYNLFLRGRHLLKRRGWENIERSIELFKEAVDRDSAFRRAHIAIAEAYTLLPDYAGVDHGPMLELALEALDEAGTEASSEAAKIRAFIHHRHREWSQADALFRSAIAASPDDAGLYQSYSHFLGHIGRFDKAIEAARRSITLDPLSAVNHQRLAMLSIYVGDLATAREHLAIAEELGLGTEATPEIAVGLLIQAGLFDEASKRATAIQHARNQKTDWIAPVLEALAGQAEMNAALRSLQNAYLQGDVSERFYFGALMYLDEADAIVQALDHAIEDFPRPIDVEFLFADSLGRSLREHDAFPEILDRLGLVAYWRETGLPPMCREEQAGRVRCEAASGPVSAAAPASGQSQERVPPV